MASPPGRMGGYVRFTDAASAAAAAASAAVGAIIYSFINFCLFYVNLFIADCPWPPGELITHADCPPRVGINCEQVKEREGSEGSGREKEKLADIRL